MAQLGTRFKAEDHNTEPQEFELLPDMIARLEVVKGDVKANDDGKGTTLALAYSVIEPEEYKGRQFFAWLDLENDESSKQERGQRDLASLCRAIGLAEVEDSDELMFQAFTAKVKKGTAGVSKAGREYKARNSISRFYYPDVGDAPEVGVLAGTAAKPANDNRPASGDARTTQNGGAAATAAAGGKSRPWGRK